METPKARTSGVARSLSVAVQRRAGCAVRFGRQALVLMAVGYMSALDALVGDGIL